MGDANTSIVLWTLFSSSVLSNSVNPTSTTRTSTVLQVYLLALRAGKSFWRGRVVPADCKIVGLPWFAAVTHLTRLASGRVACWLLLRSHFCSHANVP